MSVVDQTAELARLRQENEVLRKFIADYICDTCYLQKELAEHKRTIDALVKSYEEERMDVDKLKYLLREANTREEIKRLKAKEELHLYMEEHRRLLRY